MQPLSEQFDRRLGRAVDGLAGHRNERAHARHVHQRGLGAAQQVRQEGPHHVDHAPEVDLQHAFDVGGLELDERLELLNDAGHVEHAVHLAVGVDHRLWQGVHRVGVGDVQHVGAQSVARGGELRGAVQPLGAQVDCGHPSARRSSPSTTSRPMPLPAPVTTKTLPAICIATSF